MIIDGELLARELHLNGSYILEADDPALPMLGAFDDHIWFEPSESCEKGMLFKIKNEYETNIANFFKSNILPFGKNIWGKPSFLDVCVNRGVEQASYVAHTDYHDGDIDFFALLYPTYWNSDLYGGHLVIEDRCQNSSSGTQVIAPTITKIVILNNMNPYFKHKVTSIHPSDEIPNRVLCTVSWKRGNFR